MPENKHIPLLTFLTMLFSLTLLCIFLHFAGLQMDNIEKGIAIAFISLIAVLSCVCIGAPSDKKKSTEISMNKDRVVYVVYTEGKNKAKYCCLHHYDSLEDMKKTTGDAEKIFLLEGACINKELIAFLAEKGWNSQY